MEIIAEVKTLSPFGWRSKKSWDELFAIAERIGDMISIHTDLRWGGSWELLERARRLTQKPILAKGIHASDDDIKRALSLGADCVLVVGRVPEQFLKESIIEPYSLSELKSIPRGSRVLWNTRDLTTGGIKRETFEDARMLWRGWLCQASFIKTPADIKNGADAILVGTHLVEFANARTQQ